MSTQTNHLGLHQWEPEDDFLRTDFNEDFGKIDAGVKTVADALTTEASARQSADSAEAAAREATVAAEASAREAAVAAVSAAVAALTARVEGGVVAGSYAPVSPYSQLNIDLGFSPKLVVFIHDCSTFTVLAVLTGSVCVDASYGKTYRQIDVSLRGAAITDTGFTVNASETLLNSSVVEGTEVFYVAFR